MAQKIVHKRGQKLAKKWTKFSRKASEDSAQHIKENVIERIDHVRNVRLLILEWSLLVATVIFIAITQAVLYAESYATITFKDGGTYTEATLGKVSSLNPLFATTSSEKTISKLLFGTLSAPDYSGHTGLDLASSITAEEDGKIWHVQLKDNLKWSDGEPITNADVLYTVKVLQDPNVNSSYSSNLAGVKVAEGTDGDVEFTLSRAYANFPSSLDLPILPSHILSDVAPELLLEHNFSSSPVTSGPFIYNATQSVGTDGEKIVYLAPNPSYINGQPMLASFAVHAYPTLTEVKNAIKSGTVTATAELSPADSDELVSVNIIERQTALSSGVFAFLNTTSEALSNTAIRTAIRQGLDMTQLRSGLKGESSLDYPLISTQIYIPSYPALPQYDLTAAKQVIASAETTKDLRVVTVNTGYLPELAQNLAEQLNGLGFNATVYTFDPTQDFLVSFIQPRAYDILLYEVELGPDPDLLPYYHSSQASETGLNLSNYKNSLADDALLGARSTMDAERRAAKYQTFLKYWVEDTPAIGIYQTNLSYYVNKNVRTFSVDNRLVYPEDRFEDVQYWASEKIQKNRTP